MPVTEYRIRAHVDGGTHTLCTIGCWGADQDWLPTNEDRRQHAKRKLDEYRRYRRILSSSHAVVRDEDIWMKRREVGEWEVVECGT